MKSAIRAVFALGVTLAQPAFAGDAQTRFAVRGVGITPCAEFVKKAESNAPDLVAYVAWADGALSAANRRKQGVFEAVPILDPPGIFANIVLNICRANPKVVYDTAVTQTIELMKPLWVATAQDYTEIKLDSGMVRIYPDTLKALQQKLVEKGYLEGQPDGTFGAKTQAAIEAFQKEKGRKVTGLPDAETIIALMLGS